MFFLFVYGSLKPGECNFDQVEGWLRGSTPARGPGRLYLRPDGYPALALEGESEVDGVLLELDPQAMPELDRFEGYVPGGRSDYLRVEVTVQVDGRELPAWSYVCPVVQSGWQPIDAWPLPGRARPNPYVTTESAP